jgi:glutamate-1-semialdehyde aminotransferase
MEREVERFEAEHPRSRELFERERANLLAWAAGVQAAIDRHALPWTVQRLGCRAEYWFTPSPPSTGGEAAAADDHDLARYTHLYALNRGILLTPFHNMALMSPATTEEDVDRHSDVFDEMCAELVA